MRSYVGYQIYRFRFIGGVATSLHAALRLPPRAANSKAFLTTHTVRTDGRCAPQVVEDGYEFFARRQLVTLFSAPNYCGEFDNAGAMMSVDETLMCSFQILKPAEKKRMFAAGQSARPATPPSKAAARK